jgi:phosphate transport system substrate-binding protein
VSTVKSFLVIFLLLSACTSTDIPTETPETVTLTVVISPAVFPVRLAVSTCGAQTPEAVVFIREGFTGQADADLVIRLGEPDNFPLFVAQVAQEEIVLVVNPGNQAALMTLDQVADVFSGRIRNWSVIGGSDAEIQVWTFMEADETRQIFDREVLGGGKVVPSALLAPHPSAMLEAISRDSLAVGYIPKAWSTDEVSTILLGIQLPVLVVADEVPQGAARELVACLQGELGQNILLPYYSP